MLFYLPGIAGMPLTLRLTAYSAIWFLVVVALLSTSLLVSCTGTGHGKKQQKERTPLSRCSAAVSASITCVCWVLPLAICQAVHNPTAATWSLWPVPLWLLGFWAQTFLFAYDTWSFFIQRRFLFPHKHGVTTHVHLEDGRQQQSSRTTSAPVIRAAATEAFTTGIPMAAVYCIGCLVGNWWVVFAAVYHVLFNNILAPCGIAAHKESAGAGSIWLVLLLNPFSLWQLTICNSSWQVGCATHSRSSSSSSRGNYPGLFTFWEEYFCSRSSSSSSSSSSAMTAVPLIILAGNLLCQLCLSLLLQCFLTWTGWMLLCWFGLYVMLPAAMPAWVIDRLNIPQFVNTALAPVLEAFRRDYGITYPIQLTKGAFRPSAVPNLAHTVEHSSCSRNCKKSCSSLACSLSRSSSSQIMHRALSDRLLHGAFTSPVKLPYVVATDTTGVRDKDSHLSAYRFTTPASSSSSNSSNRSGRSSSLSYDSVTNAACNMPLPSVSRTSTTTSSVSSSTASTTCSTDSASSTTRSASIAEAHCHKGAATVSPSAYLFVCHPTGLLSRAAFLTFAAKGPGSPVSGLRTRLAIGRQLMLVPLLREVLLAIGCCEATPTAMQNHLQAGTSVAVTPGGWRETQHSNTYNLILQKRKGFVKVAADSGAALVPVLCLGEHCVVTAAGNAGNSGCVLNFLRAWRPVHQRVVFGRPLVMLEGESIEQLHWRYIKALLALGKDHGVTLNIVE